ncbi:MAG: nucleotidyltransferase domain-containing protein [Gammaproteobacteria bacterium]|nr:nucleotidyltransferase domain-containing protein [Gammaproteobacteria bacterium]
MIASHQPRSGQPDAGADRFPVYLFTRRGSQVNRSARAFVSCRPPAGFASAGREGGRFGALARLLTPLRAALGPLADHIRAAFVYGSVAKSTDQAASDIDLMVIADKLGYTEGSPRCRASKRGSGAL